MDAIYSSLTDVMAHFCAVLDYPDEDLDPFQTQQLQEALQAQEEALTALLRTSRRGGCSPRVSPASSGPAQRRQVLPAQRPGGL
ncbi:MAG: hypothetical protein ACLS43_07535 [Evtepia gabavorous]